MAPEILETYVGVYELSPDLSLVVSIEDGGLFLEPTGQGKYPMFAESETKFFLRVAGVRMTFMRDEEGRVTGLTLHQGGRDQLAAKVQ